MLLTGSEGGPVWERTLTFSNPGSWLDVIEQGGPLIATELRRSGAVARVAR
jgi:hypothetical protein